MIIESTRPEKRRKAKRDAKIAQYLNSKFSANEFLRETLENRNKYHPHIGMKERQRYA